MYAAGNKARLTKRLCEYGVHRGAGMVRDGRERGVDGNWGSFRNKTHDTYYTPRSVRRRFFDGILFETNSPLDGVFRLVVYRVLDNVRGGAIGYVQCTRAPDFDGSARTHCCLTHVPVPFDPARGTACCT